MGGGEQSFSGYASSGPDNAKLGAEYGEQTGPRQQPPPAYDDKPQGEERSKSGVDAIYADLAYIVGFVAYLYTDTDFVKCFAFPWSASGFLILLVCEFVKSAKEKRFSTTCACVW